MTFMLIQMNVSSNEYFIPIRIFCYLKAYLKVQAGDAFLFQSFSFSFKSANVCWLILMRDVAGQVNN